MIKNKSIYLLVCLIEECAEVVQSACKAIRFGLEARRPWTDRARTSNAEDIVQEFTEAQALMDMLRHEGVLDKPGNPFIRDLKRKKVIEYMKLSRRNGMLDDGGQTDG